MAQVTTLDLTGVMGPIRSFSPKEEAVELTVPIGRVILKARPRVALQAHERTPLTVAARETLTTKE